MKPYRISTLIKTAQITVIIPAESELEAIQLFCEIMNAEIVDIKGRDIVLDDLHMCTVGSVAIDEQLFGFKFK